MEKNPDNSRLVEAMKQFNAMKTAAFKEKLYKDVIDAVFYVPIAVDNENNGGKKSGRLCTLVTSDKKRFLAVYSSMDEIKKSYGSRKDVMGTYLNFASIRELITRENSGFDGFIIDDKGENVAVFKEEMLPRK